VHVSGGPADDDVKGERDSMKGVVFESELHEGESPENLKARMARGEKGEKKRESRTQRRDRDFIMSQKNRCLFSLYLIK